MTAPLELKWNMAPSLTLEEPHTKPVNPGYAAAPISRDMLANKEGSRMRGLQLYLRSAKQSGATSETTALLAWNAWIDLNKALGQRLTVPDAAYGPNGELFYTWDNEAHHLELEIPAEGPAEFFYRHRGTGRLWEAEYHLTETVPEEVQEKLRLFVKQ